MMFKSVNCIAYYTIPDLFLIQILTLIHLLQFLIITLKGRTYF